MTWPSGCVIVFGSFRAICHMLHDDMLAMNRKVLRRKTIAHLAFQKSCLFALLFALFVSSTAWRNSATGVACHRALITTILKSVTDIACTRWRWAWTNMFPWWVTVFGRRILEWVVVFMIQRKALLPCSAASSGLSSDSILSSSGAFSDYYWET